MPESAINRCLVIRVFRSLLVWFAWHLTAVGVFPFLMPAKYADAPVSLKLSSLWPMPAIVAVFMLSTMVCGRPRAMAAGAFAYACALSVFLAAHPTFSLALLYGGFIALSVVYTAIMWRSR